MKVAFSLDDFCFQHKDCIPYLEDLAEYFDDFKVSLFTIPCFEGVPLSEHWDYLSNVKFKAKHILHGYYHTHREFGSVSKDEAKRLIDLGTAEFLKCGFLPIIKGFKAPNWTYSQGLVDYLKEIGFWLATYRHEDIPGLRTYDWNFDIGNGLIPKVDVIHAHGHTHNLSGPGRGVAESMENIKKNLPRDTKFLFINEFMS